MKQNHLLLSTVEGSCSQKVLLLQTELINLNLLLALTSLRVNGTSDLLTTAVMFSLKWSSELHV